MLLKGSIVNCSYYSYNNRNTIILKLLVVLSAGASVSNALHYWTADTAHHVRLLLTAKIYGNTFAEGYMSCKIFDAESANNIQSLTS